MGRCLPDHHRSSTPQGWHFLSILVNIYMRLGAPMLLCSMHTSETVASSVFQGRTLGSSATTCELDEAVSMPSLATCLQDPVGRSLFWFACDCCRVSRNAFETADFYHMHATPLTLFHSAWSLLPFLLTPAADGLMSCCSCRPGDIEFACNHWSVFENAIDMAHIHYLHSDSFGNEEAPQIKDMT